MKTTVLQAVHHKFNFSHLRRYIPISLILLLAAGLCFYQLGTEGFWIDELSSMAHIKSGRGLPPNNLIRPLYYILLRVWSQFSNDDTWLRSLSVLFALTSVYLIYQLGRRVAGELEGLICAILLTLSPLFINHAQEVRMYAVSLCFGLAGTLTLAKILTSEKSEQPTFSSMGWWAGMRFLAILSVPLNVTLLVADAIVIWLRFQHQRRVLLDFGKWFLTIGLLWSPCILSVLRVAAPSSSYATQGHVADRSAPGVMDVLRTLKFFTVWPFASQSNAIAAGFYKAFTGLLAGLLGAALIRRHHSSQLFWVAAWAFIPLAQIFIFSHISMSLWVNRYLLFVCPYIFILLAAGLTRVWRQWRTMAIALILAYIIAIGGGLVRYYTVLDRPAYNQVLEVINSQEQPDDVIVWSMYYRKALDHYYHGSAPIYWRPFAKITDRAQAEKWLDSLPFIESRCWLAFQDSELGSQILKTAIAEKFHLDAYQTFAPTPGNKNYMEVWLLTPRDK